LKSLTDLYLEINFLKDNQLELANLEQLKSFGIKVNNSKFLSESTFANTNITTLYVQSNDLEEIPNYFDRLIHLNSLTLHCQHLKIFPDTISTLSSLKRFDTYNKIAKSIDFDFNKLEKLEEFRWGQATFFPLNITDAKKLKRLTLDVSYFETIDTNELVFQNLQHFDLSFCKLQKIPKCFEALETIEGLYLTHNNFKEIEFDFQKLTNLTALNFKRAENFELIDIQKFINSIMTIKNLNFLKTPSLSKEQNKIRKNHKFGFEWIEE
jgi:Leucine-rich repeat (LRR) protein